MTMRLIEQRLVKNLVKMGAHLGDDLLSVELAGFNEFGKPTRIEVHPYRLNGGNEISLRSYTNEFWTAKQRQGNVLHEISYRACFKPQLPRLFIGRLTQPGDIVYDPLQGRGTTALEAALLGRIALGNDVSPLSEMLVRPRLNPPTYDEVSQRLKQIDFFAGSDDLPTELLVFFHPQTLKMISSLRAYLLRRQTAGELDPSDDWIRMVALNRLTGHSPGFFSVYTLPPNQAVSAARQRIINAERNQVPPPRDVPALILKKTRQLLRDCDPAVLNALREVGAQARFFTKPADQTPDILDNSVSLVVTSPPFLDVVDYAGDN